ncbi:hypothetical protein F4778DRAFT_782914 [Xylariomycetidae sp. FL2044]|nr:hypothetical protein F4778DRAFT_782914 [Xylariomycetidae sp. FL2044]
MDPRTICQILTPMGMLGYGVDEQLVDQELAQLVNRGLPTAIILDSGSTDSGPQKLALGSMSCPRSAYVNDLKKLLRLVHKYRVPLVFGSAGGDGTDEHVKEIGTIIEEISALPENKDYCFKTLSIFSSIDKAIVTKRFREGHLNGCGPCVPPATEEQIENSARIVAQIGFEPFTEVMDAHPDFDVIIGGRAYDPSPYAAYCVHQLKRQIPATSSESIRSYLGGFHHMGKIMECGGLCSLPKSAGAVATVYETGLFDIRPLAPNSICSPLSVAAHALYENTQPNVLRGPGGKLILEDVRYEQLPDGRTTRASGAIVRPSKADDLPYQWKLEAAQMVGYRGLFLCHAKDYILIANIDTLLASVKGYVQAQHKHVAGPWDLNFHVYGKGAPNTARPGEITIIAESLAPTQQLANSIASKARVALIHGPYPGQKATAGNVGFGIGGLMEIELGPCAEFSLYHVMDLEPGEHQHITYAEESAAPPTQRSGALLHYRLSTIGKGARPKSDWKPRARIPPPLDEIPSTTSHPTPQHLTTESSKITTTTTINQAHPHTTPTKTTTEKPTKLSDLCSILRSKNAGPFEITIDALFATEADYRRVKTSTLLSRANVARALAVAEADIIWMGFFDPARAFKVTIPRVRGGRTKSAGGFMEDDVHGSQEHLGIADIGLEQLLPPQRVGGGGVTENLRGLLSSLPPAAVMAAAAAAAAAVGSVGGMYLIKGVLKQIAR